MFKSLISKHIFVFFCIVVLCILLLWGGIAFLIQPLKGRLTYFFDNLIISHGVDEAYCANIETYLEQKYKKEVVIDEYLNDYRGAPGVRVHFLQEPEIQFVSYDNYDYYLASCLEFEAEKRIIEACNGFINVTDLKCAISYEDTNLSAFYEENGRPLSWKDAESTETISIVRIYYTPIEKFDILQAKQLTDLIIKAFGEREVFKYSEISFICDSSQLVSNLNFDFLIKHNKVQ